MFIFYISGNFSLNSTSLDTNIVWKKNSFKTIIESSSITYVLKTKKKFIYIFV